MAFIHLRRNVIFWQNILYHLRSSRASQKICSAVIFIPKYSYRKRE
nr:MAG TPA: hypothetical protein [Caudoviricetes sp.]DAP60821.1 MAG TPA: hypothetical protein [Caudoviricetes sp.]DAZ80485.1 MAG TPA: hypothetical protein [Caudoviricetes sp.]